MIESNWKLFRSKYPLWVERYMETICEKYKQILNSNAPASEKYSAIKGIVERRVEQIMEIIKAT